MESSQTYFILLSDSLFKKMSVEETSVSFLVKYLKVRQTALSHDLKSKVYL